MTSPSSFAIDHPPAANDAGVRRPWTIEEDMLLLTKGPVYGYATVAEQLGRTGWAGVQRQARLKAANQDGTR